MRGECGEGGVDGEPDGLSGCLSDPVNTASGAFTHTVTDVELPGPGLPFKLVRAYTSADMQSGVLGQGWVHSYASKLITEADGDRTLHWGSGQRVRFDLQPNGSYLAPQGIDSTLTAVGGGFEVKTPDLRRFTFDTGGKLTQIKDRSDNTVSLTYASGVLTTVTDTAGRVITFTHDGSGRLTQVALPDGRSVSYGYTSGRLTSVTDLREQTSTYSYDTGGRLATEVNPSGQAIVQNTYDASGRVVQQRDPLNNLSTFSYTQNPDGSKTTTMTDARGKVWRDIYRYNMLQKRIDPLGNQTTVVRDAELNLAEVPRPGLNPWLLTWDSNGNLTKRKAVAPFNFEETFTYNTQNNPTSSKDALNRTTTYAYDADGNLTQVTDPGGATTAITRHPTTGLPTAVTDARGKTWTYTYDTSGNLTEVRSPLDLRTTMTYDSRGFMTSRTDPRGNEAGANPADFTTTYTYDAAGNVLTETDPLGSVTTNVYDAAGRLDSRTDARNKTTTYAYNAASEVTKVTAPDGGETTFTYDASGNLLSETDPEGGPTSYTYDASGRMASKTDPRGKTSTYTYGPAGQLLSETSPLGNKTTYAYDALGRQISRTDPRGNAPGATPADHTFTFAYNPVGNLTRETDPLGGATSFTHDHRGRLLSRTDAASKTTTYAYDAAGNLVSETDPAGGATVRSYDDDGRLVLQTDPRSKTSSLGYDAAGNLIQATTPLGFKETMTYDAAGRLASRTDPRGNEPGATPSDYRTSFAYDAVGNLLQDTDPLGKTTTYAYDDVGNRTTKTDALGRQTTYTYDRNARMTSVLAPDLALTSYAYDATGNLTSRTDANNHTMTLAFDSDGRLVTETTPLGNVRSYAYDPDGNLTTETDPRGNATPTAGDFVISNTYDRAGRLTATDYSDATPDVAFTYDPRGLRTQMSDGSGTETRTYDDAGRLVSVARGATSLSYLYDAGSNVTRRTYPGGVQANLTYHDDGRLASVAGPGGTTTYAYDASGRQTEATRPNGTNTQTSYDRVGRPSSISHRKGTSPFATYAYTYDAAGNPTTLQTPEGQVTYAYDAQDRLTQACYVQACGALINPVFIRYTYDEVGNRLSEVRPTGTTTHTYDSDDRLTASSGSTGATLYTHDAAGNMTDGGARTLTYDLAGLTKTITDGASVTTYSYDGDGKRTSATNGATTTNLVWDPNAPIAELLEEQNGSGALVRRYTQGNELLSVTTPAATSFYHADALGSVVSVTDAAGDQDWSHAYEPFGGDRTTVQRDLLAPAQPMRFTGQHLDPTGLYHLRARQLDPALGRFTARDPVPPAPSTPLIATYAYADNHPTVLVDPSGQRGISLWERNLECPIIGSAIAGAFGLEREFCEGYASLPWWAQGLDNAAITGGSAGLVVASLGCVVQPTCFVLGTVGGTGLTKATAREAVRNAKLPPAQQQAALRAISRATTTSSIDLLRRGGEFIVKVSRPGRDGYQVIETLTNRHGLVRVVQRAYDSAGRLVHYEQKYP